MTNKELKTKLAAIESDLMTIFHTSEKEEWDKFWKDKAIEILNHAQERFENLARGKMLVYDPTTEPKPFWVRIMKSVKHSIWTTNIASRNTFGSDLNQLLNFQKEAVNRGVEIERIFIYDLDNEVEIANLSRLLMNQLHYGIKCYTISNSVFQASIEGSGIESTRSNDFMIIDDGQLYETKFNPDSQSFRNCLIRIEQEVEKMKTIKEHVMKSVVEVDLGNINKFPNII